MVKKQKSSLDKTIQLLIPPLLVALLTLTIFEVFYDLSAYSLFINIFDLFIITIFTIDLRYRWLEIRNLKIFIKKHFLDIIATIPFNFIFIGVNHLTFTRALRGARPILRLARLARYGRLFRLARYTRFLRFLRMKKHIKKTGEKVKQKHELAGTLGFKVILLITINSIMGTGIWFLTSAGAKHAGPASLISWGILALISIYIAMCFSELVSMYPKAGGVYEYAKQAYGRFASFIIGWSTSIAGSVTIAMLLLGALQYLIPIKYSFYYIPIALALIIIFNAIAYRGMQTSTYMLVTFALITLVTVLAIIVPGLFSINIENYTPFFIFPSLNILLAIFFIAETFFGWESATFLSSETKNPKVVMPKALIYGTIVIAILALLLSVVGLGIMPWQDYGESSAPLRDLGQVLFGGIGKIFFTIFVFTSIIGAVACWVVTAPRLLMSIAEDKLFFVQFAKVHPKHKSPYVSIIFQVLVVSTLVIIGSGKYETLLHMLVPLILFVYSSVLFSVTYLRFKQPNTKRAFKVPFGKVGPILTIGFMIFLLIMFIKHTHGALDILKISASLILLGVPAYFLIELFYDKPYVKLRRIVLVKFLHYFNLLPFKKITFNKIYNFLGPYKKTDLIVDYDSSAGAFSKIIINKKTLHKEIIVVTRTKEEQKLIKALHKNIKIKYQKDLNMSGLSKIDKFVSFQSLGFVDNIDKFLTQFSKSLEKNAKFAFYIRHHFLYVTPNAVEIGNFENLKKSFKKVGLEITINTKKKLFGREYLILGTKKK